MTITIRTATVEDAAYLAELGARTFEAAFGADNTPEDMTAYLAEAFGPHIQRSQIADPNNAFLFAERDGAILGFVQLRCGEAPECVSGVNPVEVARIYADVPWIGRGVGSALMTAALGHAAAGRHDVIWLDVWEHNPRAIAFYERWGFSIVGEQTFVLGSDAQRDLVMQRPAD